MSEFKFTLRVVTNKHKTKVLFAEVDSDFADILISFLTLPLGKIVRILNNHYGTEAPVFGSLNSLSKGLENLDNVHFPTKECKTMLLDPKSTFDDERCELKINIDYDAQPVKYFACRTCSSKGVQDVIMYYDSYKCYCTRLMDREFRISRLKYGGVFAVDKMSFLISDELCLVPNVTGSVLQTLESLCIGNVDGTEECTVTFGFNEIMDLLRRSLLSKTPLTDIVLRRRKRLSPTVSEFGNLLYQMVLKDVNHSNSDKTMIVKVMIQKSTNKLLFAQAEEDFVDFLFSFLTIPLGTVVHLLDGKTCITNIDNLYRCLGNINGKKHLKSQDMKNRLLKPELPPKFVSMNQIFPLIEQNDTLYYNVQDIFGQHKEYLSNHSGSSKVKIRDPKGWVKCYVKGPRMFMIRDDLTVTPLCVLSSLSILNEMNIPLSDAKEVELRIGLQEALRILRASLTSTSALTTGLMSNPVIKKQIKEEH